MTVNKPQVVAEVREAFETYEQALLSNDVPALQSFFWKSPEAVRYGAAEELYGFDEIASFRAGRVLNFSRRTPVRVVVSTFGDDTASVMFEYRADINGVERLGRQSQTWVRMESGWKIVTAHISYPYAEEDFSAYVSKALKVAALYPNPDWLERIQSNFAATEKLAQKLMAYPLPKDVEPAPVFEP